MLRDDWDRVSQATDTGELNVALRNGGVSDLFQQAYHVAVDRWTAEPKDHALFTVLEPHGIEWEAITMTLDETRLATHTKARLATRALLLLVLRDFSRGIIPLGFAVNRGMGGVKDVKITVTGDGIACTIVNGVITPEGWDISALETAWQNLTPQPATEEELTHA